MGPEQVLNEAYQVLRPGDWLGVCDGDFSTATLAIGELDPLEVCVKAFVEGFVNDRWMVRRMSHLMQEAGFDVAPQRSYRDRQTQRFAGGQRIQAFQGFARQAEQESGEEIRRSIEPLSLGVK